MDLLVVEKSLFPLDLGGISDKILVNILSGPSHIHFSLVFVLSQEVGKGSTVIQVGMRDNDHGNLGWVYLFEERKTVRIFLVDHKSAVQHDLFIVDGEDEAGTTYLAACSER